MCANSMNGWFWTSEYLAELKYQEGQQLNKRNTYHSWTWVLCWRRVTWTPMAGVSSQLFFRDCPWRCLSFSAACTLDRTVRCLLKLSSPKALSRAMRSEKHVSISNGGREVTFHVLHFIYTLGTEVGEEMGIGRFRFAHWWVHSGRKFSVQGQAVSS